MFRAESVLRLWTSSRINGALSITQSMPHPIKPADAGPENAFRGLALSDALCSPEQGNAHIQLPMDVAGSDVADAIREELTDSKNEIAQLKETLVTLQETLRAQNRMHEALVAEQEAEILRLQDELATARDQRENNIATEADAWAPPQRSVPLALPQKKSVISLSGARSTKRPCVEDSFDHEAMAGRSPTSASRPPVMERVRLGCHAASGAQTTTRCSTASTLSVPVRAPPAPFVKGHFTRTPSGVSASPSCAAAALHTMPVAGWQ
jgi:hypothetical protein